MARGFYSVVQYCPDPFRAEAVNVGLVLLCAEPHAAARADDRQSRPRTQTLRDRQTGVEEFEVLDGRPQRAGSKTAPKNCEHRKTSRHSRHQGRTICD